MAAANAGLCVVTLPVIPATGFDAASLSKVWTLTGCSQTAADMAT
jgi:hypothetical protein